MAIGSLPAFQRALLKARAQAEGTGRKVNTSGLTSRLSEEQLRRQLAYQSIAQSKLAREESARQFNANMKLRKKKLQSNRRELPLRIGLGIAGMGVSGLQGVERRNILQKQNQRQEDRDALLQDQMNKRSNKGILKYPGLQSNFPGTGGLY